MSDFLDNLAHWIYYNSSNVTTQDDYREMLREFESFFEYVFNSSRDGISILDLDFNILGVNYTIEGWHPNKKPLVGKKCYEVYRGNSQPCEDCPTIQAIRSRKPSSGVVSLEIPITDNGRQELYVFPLFDDHDIMFGVIEWVRDITLPREEEIVIDNLKNRLRLKDRSLQEQEAALKMILQCNEKNETNMAETVVTNMTVLVEPLLDRLQTELESASSLNLMEMIRERLKEITSPFLKKLSLSTLGLTRRELEIAGFIKDGKTSKEIATLIGITEKGVEFHRLKIRKKIGLSNTKENLYSYLQTLYY